MARFFIQQLLECGQRLELPDNMVRHMYALRVKVGQHVELFNGDGDCYLATINNIGRNSLSVTIGNKTTNKPPIDLSIDLAISLIANNKMDLVIQKATELGVKSITPIISHNSQHKDNETLSKKLARWQSIVISSCEQCGLNRLPQISLVNSFKELLTSSKQYNHKIILSPQITKSSPNHNSNNDSKRILLLVGPEGGFNSDEINQALDYQFIPLTLGTLTLRSETAVIAGITTLYNKYSANWVQ
jgi:16S rRNA (uracil1498-N3)-methyltransferase